MPSVVGKIYEQRGRYHIRLKGGTRIFVDKRHRSFYSRQEAEVCLSQICGEIENGTFDEDFYSKSKKSLYSFSVYAEEWLGNYEKLLDRGERSPTYLKDVRRFVKKEFIPFFGDISLLEMTGRNIREYFMTLTNHPKTISNKMAVLHKMFHDAVDDEIIPKIPNFPKQNRIPDPDWKWCNVDEQDEVLSFMDDDSLYFIFFLMTHATRPGEARALQHGDIDLLNNEIIIRRSFAGNVLRETTKTYRIRKLLIDSVWKEIYLSLPRNLDPNAFVFTKNGKPISESWMRKKWKEACAKAGVINKRLYDGTRHSYGTQASRKNAPIVAIQRVMGHSNIRMTTRYIHSQTDALKITQREPSKVVSMLSARRNQSTATN